MQNKITDSNDSFKNCRVLNVAIKVSASIYEKSATLQNTEHYTSGAANKMRNHSDKLVSKIRSGWIKKFGSKKALDYSNALEHAHELVRLIDISIKLDDVQETWDEPKAWLIDEVIPQLRALYMSAR